MIKDYHTHPQIIKDIKNFDAFAATALKNGVEEVCITDHMPLSCSDAADRIPAGRIGEYCEKGAEIKEKYKGILSVKLGIEIDWHPSVRAEVEDVLRAGKFDFVLGSSHLHAITPIDIFGTTGTRTKYAEAMFENTITAAESGYFDAIPHVDMYKWIFADPKRFPLEDDGYCEERIAELIDRTLDVIKSRDMFLEINPHFAVSDKDISKVYPSVWLVEKALAKGIKFSYGSDSHVPEDIGVMLPDLKAHAVYSKALENWEGK